MTVEQIKTLLLQAEKKGRLASSYLLTGGTPALREDVASFFSQLVVCAKTDNKPCGKCTHCRQVSKNLHPDIQWIIPEKGNLGIDEVRKVKEEIYLKPFSGGRKAYLFFIDHMKEEAANSFLKILEEPPFYGFIVIITANIHNFLPTIVSRCQQLKINFTLPEQNKAMKESWKFCVSLLTSLQENQFQNFFDRMDTLVKNLDRNEVEKWLENILWLFRDQLLRDKKVKEDLLVSDETCDILKGRRDLLDKTELVLEMKQKVRLNINLRIALEYLFAELMWSAPG